jgi:hypothetical protein
MGPSQPRACPAIIIFRADLCVCTTWLCPACCKTQLHQLCSQAGLLVCRTLSCLSDTLSIREQQSKTRHCKCFQISLGGRMHRTSCSLIILLLQVMCKACCCSSVFLHCEMLSHFASLSGGLSPAKSLPAIPCSEAGTGAQSEGYRIHTDAVCNKCDVWYLGLIGL